MEFLALLGIGLLITLLVVPWVALSKANDLRRELERVKFDLELLTERVGNGAATEPRTASDAESTSAESSAVKSVAPEIAFKQPETLSPPHREEPSSATSDLEILARAREFEARTRAQSQVDEAARIEQDQNNEFAFANASEPIVPREPSAFELQLQAWIGAAKEWLFGGNLVAKVGLLILFIGVAFLVRLASNYVTVPIELRLAGVAAGAIALLVWGWRIRESRRGIALPVQGASLAILMLVTFGAFKLFHVVPGGAAFALLFVLIAFTCALAILQDALWLAIFGIAGGFAAPILTSTGGGNHIALFSYYCLLNAGVLAIALKRSWRMLNVLGFAFTFIVGAAWGEQRYVAENFASAQTFLIVFWLFYIAIAIVYAWRRAPELKSYVDGTIVFGVPMAGMALQYGLVKDVEFGMSISALAVALTYAAVASALWRWRQSTLRLLVESFLALAIVFGTLTIPLAFDGRWTSAAWAVEGAAIVWIGLKQKQKLAWQFGIAVQLGSWIAFISALAGLDPVGALKGNVGLSFLLLGVTGVLLALMFRSSNRVATDSQAGEPDRARTRFGWLASGFIGVAVVWLLLGMWVEVWLRVHGAQRATLLVATALVLVYALQFLGKKSAWQLPNVLGGAVMGLAGIVFVFLMATHMSWPGFGLGFSAHYNEGTLFELLRNSSLLGGLMLCGGSLVSAFSFKNHDAESPLLTRERSDRVTTMWFLFAVFWWSGFALHGLAHVVAFVTSAHGGGGLAKTDFETSLEQTNWYAISFWPAYAIGLALSALAWTQLALRKRFPHPDLLCSRLWPLLTGVGAAAFFLWVWDRLAWTHSFGRIAVSGSASDAFMNLIAGPLLGALILCALYWYGLSRRESEAPRSDPHTSSNALFWTIGLGACWYGLVVDVVAQWAANTVHAFGYPNSQWLGTWGYPQSEEFSKREFAETSKSWQLEYRDFAVLLSTASAIAFLTIAKRTRMEIIRWLATPAAALQMIASVALLFVLYLKYALPTVGSVAALVGCWFGVAWSLRYWQGNEWPLSRRLLQMLHFGRVLAPWLAIVPAVSLVTARWLRNAPEQSSGDWIVVGMWPDYLAAWIGVGSLLTLLRQAKNGGRPLAPLHEWYRRAMIPLATAWGVLLVIYWNIRQDGGMAPLPYVPILNPLDITTGFVAILGVAVWRSNSEALTARAQALGLKAGLSLAFGWLNLMLLRTASHYLDIPYRFQPLYHSQFVQAMLSIVWTLTAFLLMRYAVRALSKPLWMVGAALLAVVVGKLFLVDLSNVGSIARIVSFIGVGGLMLLIGYIAPLPRQTESAQEEPGLKNPEHA